MTIKQLGGVFGRNPTFNDVTIEGELTFDGDIDINSNLKVSGELEVIGNINSTGRMRAAGGSDQGTQLNMWTTVGGDGSLAAYQLVFNTGPNDARVEGARFTPSGNLAFVSGKGIDFSAIAGTGTSELFDDYEEGLHTATVVCGTSGTVTVNAGNNSLAYTKIGRQVSVTGFLYIDSVSSPVGYFDISLPITSANLAGGAGNSAASLIVRNVNTANVSSFVGYIPEASSVIRVYLGDSTNWVADSAEELKAVSQIYINATYMAA